MHFIRFVTSFIGRARSWAVPRITARRRHSVKIATALALAAGLTCAATPALATTYNPLTDYLESEAGPCVGFPQYANQLGTADCDYASSWVPTGVNYGGWSLTQFQEEGTNLCLDADAGQVYPGGAIILWPCNNQDPYQLWEASPLGDQFMLANWGTYTNQNVSSCLDADDGGFYMIQWPCDPTHSDPWQVFTWF